jgi:hypothetical protein
VKTTLLLVAWWVSFILSCTASRVANSAVSSASESNEVSGYLVASYSEMIASSIMALAGLVAISVVHRITQRQDRRAAMYALSDAPLESHADRE